jgi:hypothetical protein
VGRTTCCPGSRESISREQEVAQHSITRIRAAEFLGTLHHFEQPADELFTT